MMHQIARVGSGSQIRGVRAGTTQPAPPSEDWAPRSDVPTAINPAGTLWKVEYQSDFTGPANSAPPAPWHTGIEWAGAHPQLGGHVWRDQVNLDSHAYLDGSGHLVLKLDWDATYGVAKGGYLITDQDGSTVRDGDYRVDPTAEDGVLIEIVAALPADQPSASWCAGWTFATVDATPLHSSLSGQAYLREEIDIFEHIGNAPPYYEETFHTNTHGRQPGLLSDCAADEGHAAGEGFRPDTMWGGDPPNDGNPHTWSLMWEPDPDGAQAFFYDGHQYATRPKSGDIVHSRAHGIRLSWETAFPGGAGNPFGAGAADPATETALFPRLMTVHSVRVLRRRLPAPSYPSPGKPTDAPVLQAKGLSLIWQDRLGETDAPTDDRQFFQATTGNRISEDPVTSSLYSFPGENNRRLSFVTYDGRPCIKATYFANAHGWLNHRTQYLPNRYRELGLCVDFKYPADFNLRSVTGGDIHGKSMFGLLVGHVDFQRPGVPSSRAWAGEVYWPEDQWGGALGLNTRYRVSQPGNISYRWYPHVIGAYVNGADRFRLDKYSNLYSIPGYVDPGSQAIPTGVWHRLEIYGKVDTNRRDGVLEMWVDGTLRARAANLDLGGWVGNRGLAARTVGNGTNGDGSLSAGTGQLVGSSGGGWRFCGIFQRDMLGGSTSLQSLVPQYGGAYYAYNWRVYGRV